MSRTKGDTTRAERIRELLAKGKSREVIMLRVGCKPSEIERIAAKAVRS